MATTLTTPTAHAEGSAFIEGAVYQGPSHGGSYMDEGMSHIRIRLPPRIVSWDCPVFPSHFMPPSLSACARPMSDDTGLY